jgi:hypothetical protein
MLSTVTDDYHIIPFSIRNESYANLPWKTYHMLQVAQRMACDVNVKLDTDGMLCLNKLDPQVTGDAWKNVYIGKRCMSKIAPPSAKSRHRHHKWFETVNMKIYNRIQKHTFTPAEYMLGGAYAIGSNVVNGILKHSYDEYIDTGFEDANLGLYVNNLAFTDVISVEGSDTTCKRGNRMVYFHKCRTHGGLCDRNISNTDIKKVKQQGRMRWLFNGSDLTYY